MLMCREGTFTTWFERLDLPRRNPYGFLTTVAGGIQAAHRPGSVADPGRCQGQAKRRTNSSEVCATSRQPLSMVIACPRPGISTNSVTPGLSFCWR